MLKKIIAMVTLSLMSSLAFAELYNIPAGQPGKHPGEIISPITRNQIANWCNFSMQIVSMGNGQTLCVYNGSQSVD